MSQKEQDISREAIFTVLAGDADGYYKLVLTVASAFLGGSLVFLDKIVPYPSRPALALMVLGWGSLVAAVAFITSVRQRNLRSGYLVLENKVDEARKLDVVKDKHSEWAARFLIVGMAFIVLADVVALWSRPLGGTVK